MADFREAFSVGINAADKAEQNRNEISAVFSELNDQLSEVTNGKVLIKRQARSKLKNKLDIFGDRVRYTVISAINSEADANEDLALWTQDRAGYPCKIVLDGEEIYCGDKAAVEDGLSMLLQDPVVGEKLKMLMQLEPKNDNSSNSGPTF